MEFNQLFLEFSQNPTNTAHLYTLDGKNFGLFFFDNQMYYYDEDLDGISSSSIKFHEFNINFYNQIKDSVAAILGDSLSKTLNNNDVSINNYIIDFSNTQIVGNSWTIYGSIHNIPIIF